MCCKKIFFFDQWKIFVDAMNEIEKDPQYTPEMRVQLLNGNPSKAYEIFIEGFLADKRQLIETTIDSFRKNSLTDIKNNQTVLENTWGEGFALYEYYINACIQFCDSFSEYLIEHCNINEKSSGIKIYTAIRYLNGRSIQVANEILVLLRNGYADGAYARFRTLYELTIVSHFIFKYGDDIANDYIAYKGSYYGWAQKIFPKCEEKNIKFSHIKKRCGIEEDLLKSWNNEYFISNKLIHASPQGTFSRLAQGNKRTEILVGPSDFGIALPAGNALMCLLHVNKIYFRCFEQPIAGLWCLALQEITKMCFETFSDIEKTNFPQKDTLK